MYILCNLGDICYIIFEICKFFYVMKFCLLLFNLNCVGKVILKLYGGYFFLNKKWKYKFINMCIYNYIIL